MDENIFPSREHSTKVFKPSRETVWESVRENISRMRAFKAASYCGKAFNIIIFRKKNNIVELSKHSLGIMDTLLLGLRLEKFAKRKNGICL